MHDTAYCLVYSNLLGLALWCTVHHIATHYQSCRTLCILYQKTTSSALRLSIPMIPMSTSKAAKPTTHTRASVSELERRLKPGPPTVLPNTHATRSVQTGESASASHWRQPAPLALRDVDMSGDWELAVPEGIIRIEKELEGQYHEALAAAKAKSRS